MASRNGTRFGTNFTMSIEAAEGVDTGISAADRARTIQVAVARDAKPADIVQPGHIFPVQAVRGGVLVRAGHTEAGCDLTALAGLTPAAVICEILKPDGTMARLPDLIEFAREHGLKIGTIADLIQYRSEHESMVERIAQRSVKTAWGQFQAVAYRDLASSDAVHLALVHGTVSPDTETLVRVHEPTTVLDVLLEGATSHSWSVSNALKTIAAAPSGVLILLNCQGSDELLLRQFQAWNEPPVPSDALPDRESRYGLRTYGIGAQIMRDLNVGKARLLSRPRKMPSMTGFSLTITGYDSEPNDN
jgi:3,4-dihydroxy 2-butanone 4-phosphate synthase/GTP cyclohydrolase II